MDAVSGDRRVRPVRNVNGFPLPTDSGPYDEAWTLQVLRERMSTFADEPYAFEAQCAGGVLADFLAKDLVGVDPVVAGRVLLAVTANANALLARGWPAVAFANVLSHAASELIGDELPGDRPVPPTA